MYPARAHRIKVSKRRSQCQPPGITIMSSNHEMFASASNRLEGDIFMIEVIYKHVLGDPPLIMASARGDDIDYEYIDDEEMNVAGWRRYGKSLKTRQSLTELDLRITENSEDLEISPDAALCLQAFFEEVKDNTSIEVISIDIDLCTAISPLDLRHFFHNNKKLRVINMCNRVRPVSPVISMNVATALRDLNIPRVNFRCEFLSTRSFERILWACQKVHTLSITCDENDQYVSLAKLLREPTAKLQMLHIHVKKELADFVEETAVSDLFVGLTQNIQLKSMKFESSLFDWDGSGEYLDKLLCNTSSLESICQSNHTLENIINYRVLLYDKKAGGWWPRYLNLNRLADKRKVQQIKIMLHYFGRGFNAASITGMPLAILPQILGIDISARREYSVDVNMDDKFECSAFFSIIKSIPELCAVSSRVAMQTEESSHIDNRPNKRRKLDV